MKLVDTILVALRSALHFVACFTRGDVRQPRRYFGFHVEDPSGTDFVAFRETVVDVHRPVDDQRSVLLIWFRLWFVTPQNRAIAWVFRRVCILTMPFFSGVRGFVSKLWMEDHPRAEYLGVYEFTSTETADAYADYIETILRLFSRRGSIRRAVIPSQTAQEYLAMFRQPPGERLLKGVRRRVVDA